MTKETKQASQITEVNRDYWDKRFWLISELVGFTRSQSSNWVKAGQPKLYVPKEHAETLVAVTCQEVMQTVYDIYHGRSDSGNHQSDVLVMPYVQGCRLKFINKEDVIFELDFSTESVMMIVSYYSSAGERKRLLLQVSDLCQR